jgi:hypothetical protein
MNERPAAVVLWGRAALVGLLTTGLGVPGHVSADGLLPGPGVLVGLAIASVLIAVPVLAREAGRLRLVGLTVGGQTLTHLVLAVSAGHRGDVRAASTSSAGAAPGGTAPSLPTSDGRRVGSLQDAFQPSGGARSHSTGLAVPGHLVSDLSDHAPMMAAHLAVAVLVGLWLAHGERAFWTLVRTTAGGLRSLVTPYVAPRPSPTARVGVPPAAPECLPHQRGGDGRAVSRRGPPVVLAAA